MNWNNDWRNELEQNDYECYIRLCECRNTRKDLITLSKLVYKYNPSVNKEDCFIYILEWVGDWNGQFELTDLAKEEFEKLLKKI